MSWGQGSTRQSRKARASVLHRDGHTCQLHYPGCTHTATEAHHLESITAHGHTRAQATDPDSMIATCRPCHRLITEQQRMKAWREKQPERDAQHEARMARRKLPTKPHPGD